MVKPRKAKSRKGQGKEGVVGPEATKEAESAPVEELDGDDDPYERARVQANKETALEALRKAHAALQAGDTDAAHRMLAMALRLDPTLTAALVEASGRPDVVAAVADILRDRLDSRLPPNGASREGNHTTARTDAEEAPAPETPPPQAQAQQARQRQWEPPPPASDTPKASPQAPFGSEEGAQAPKPAGKGFAKPAPPQQNGRRAQQEAGEKPAEWPGSVPRTSGGSSESPSNGGRGSPAASRAHAERQAALRMFEELLNGWSQLRAMQRISVLRYILCGLPWRRAFWEALWRASVMYFCNATEALTLHLLRLCCQPAWAASYKKGLQKRDARVLRISHAVSACGLLAGAWLLLYWGLLGTASRLTFWSPSFLVDVSLAAWMWATPGRTLTGRVMNLFWGFPLTWALLPGSTLSRLSCTAAALATRLLFDTHDYVLAIWTAVAMLTWLLGWKLTLALAVAAAGGLVYLLWRAAGHSSYGERADKRAAPEGATGEVKRVLDAQDYYEVLQLAKGSEALEEAALKRARREKMLLVHPDKTGHVPGGNEAFDAVNIAFETLSDPVKRRAYDDDLAYARSSKAAVNGDADDEGEGLFHCAPELCPRCSRLHRLAVLKRELAVGRWCDGCRGWHAASEGDMWLENTRAWGWRRLGVGTKLLGCRGGFVVDFTEMRDCLPHGKLLSKLGLGVNSHVVWNDAKEEEMFAAAEQMMGGSGKAQGNRKKKKQHRKRS